MIARYAWVLLGLGLAACDTAEELGGPAPPPDALRFVDLDVGYLHACALTAGGSVWCWGGNSIGALGNGTWEPSSVPVRVQSTRSFEDLDSNSSHNCAIDQARRAWCWGHNDEGQLGDGTRTPRNAPVQVVGNHEFVQISVGHAHACGLTAGGDVWCWGDDTSGQLGNGPDGVLRTSVPVRVDFGAPFAQVSAGYYQTCALTEDGEAYCWGINYVGQNGDGTFEVRHAPVPVQGGQEFDRIATGDGIVCGISDRALFCWGSNRFYELARAPLTLVLEPELVQVGDVVNVAPAIGAETIGGSRPYACAVADDGRGSCWGGAIPQIRTDGPEPTLLDGDLRFEMLAAGPQFVCGLRRDGYAYCAGANTSGQLGSGGEIDSGEMRPVVGPE